MKTSLLVSSGVVRATLIISTSIAIIGCASVSEVRSLRDEVRGLRSAHATISEEARRAGDAAEKAELQAKEANDRSVRTEEMLNRSFQRRMYK